MEFIKENERIYLNNQEGALIAEITFPAVSDSVISINRTFVDDSLRGQGIAGKLVEEALAYAKEHNKKIRPTCSYAVKWFEHHSEHAAYLE